MNPSQRDTNVEGLHSKIIRNHKIQIYQTFLDCILIRLCHILGILIILRKYMNLDLVEILVRHLKVHLEGGCAVYSDNFKQIS